jgi:hypothetical protein
MRLYLAGPMSGLPLHNFPEFHRVANYLRSYGHKVFDPAAHTYDWFAAQDRTFNPEYVLTDYQRRELLADDLSWICKHAEGVVFLQGWQESKGARAEYYAARALGIPCYRYRPESIDVDGLQLIDEEVMV